MISDFLLLVIVLLGYQSVVISSDYLHTPTDCDDCGEPLFLTPLIEDSKIEEALNLSKIIDLDNRAKSYSGYLTVNKQYKTNLFFWFFEANSENWENLPLLLWLQGGPGMSSLYAIFCENGPFKIKSERPDEFMLEKRQYAWTDEFNVLYVDSPAGTGYSHTHTKRGYSKNQNQVSNNLYKALIQFFKLFPNLRRNNFYITGESYAGKYIPALGYKIHNKNKKTKTKINLTGLFIGNAFVSPRDQLIYGDYLKMIGLIDENQRLIFNSRLAEVAVLIDDRDWLNATDKFSELFFKMFYPHPTLYRNYTGLTTHYNYIHNFPQKDEENFVNFITLPSTRRKIHAGKTAWGDYKLVAHHLKADIMKSMKLQVEALLEHYDVLFYNGQLDVICAYPGTENFFRQLKWSAEKEYQQAERIKWYVEDKLVGYYKKAGRFVDVMIRNSGHMVPTDTPLEAITLLKRFVTKNL